MEQVYEVYGRLFTKGVIILGIATAAGLGVYSQMPVTVPEQRPIVQWDPINAQGQEAWQCQQVWTDTPDDQSMQAHLYELRETDQFRNCLTG